MDSIILILKGYHLVTSEDSCGTVTTKQDCETAAMQLGIPDTTATEIYEQSRPPYCYYRPLDAGNKQLWFNTAFNSTKFCSDERKCICKVPCTEEGGCPRQLICGKDKYCYQCLNDEHCAGELVCGIDKRCQEKNGKMFWYFYCPIATFDYENLI